MHPVSRSEPLVDGISHGRETKSLQRVPNNILQRVLSQMNDADLGSAALVCRKWSGVATPMLRHRCCCYLAPVLADFHEIPQKKQKKLTPEKIVATYINKDIRIDDGIISRRVTILHQTATSGDVDLICALLTMGSKIDASDSNFRTPIVHAIEVGDIDVLKLFIRRGADISSTGVDPLLAAIRTATTDNKTDVARVLIEAGVDVNGRRSGTSSYLHEAAKWVQVEIIKLLLDRGAEVNANDGGHTPLHHALSASGHSWPEDSDFETKVTESVRLLLEHGADCTVLTRGMFSTLHLAVIYSRNSDTIRLLVERGADLNSAEGHHRMTPLHVAALHKKTGIFKLLIELGADPTLKNSDGRTPRDLLDEARSEKHRSRKTRSKKSSSRKSGSKKHRSRKGKSKTK